MKDIRISIRCSALPRLSYANPSKSATMRLFLCRLLVIARSLSARISVLCCSSSSLISSGGNQHQSVMYAGIFIHANVGLDGRGKVIVDCPTQWMLKRRTRHVHTHTHSRILEGNKQQCALSLSCFIVLLLSGK